MIFWGCLGSRNYNKRSRFLLIHGVDLFSLFKIIIYMEKFGKLHIITYMKKFTIIIYIVKFGLNEEGPYIHTHFPPL